MYYKIINKTYGYMLERISENQQKQGLIEELNNYVCSSIQEILDEEQAYFESDTRDRLKVPPYTYVKRIPRGKAGQRVSNLVETTEQFYEDAGDDEEIALSDDEP